MTNKLRLSEKMKGIRKNLKSLSARLLLCAVLAGIFVLSAYYVPHGVTYEYSHASKVEDKDTASNTAVSESLRLLREKDGKIGVFRTDGSLVRIIDVDVSALPTYDRELLSEGIVAEEAELSELVESLLS